MGLIFLTSCVIAYDRASLVYKCIAPAADPAVSAADITCMWLTLGAEAPKPVCSPPKLCEYQRGEDTEAGAAI